ncbi:MAG: PEGA domain-containing protein [Deltaproteobacteria bacterium]|nr:PEGA domain-containing protein [Deltaproteobacteria bacterium]
MERLPEGPPGPRPAGAGRIEVVASVEGASVRIDDRAAGTAPLAPVEAAPGRHSVTVTREGYAGFFTTVVVAPGETARVDAVLQRSGPGRDPAPPRDATPHRTPGRGRPEPGKAPPPAAAGVIATVPPAPDLPAAVRGAETLPAGRAAFYLDAGYPSLGLGFHARAREGLDVVPHADFHYARDVTAPFLGAGAGVRLKLRLVSARGFALAAVLDPALTCMFDEGVKAVILRVIAPWLVASYRFFTAGVTLYGGLKSPIEFVVHPSFVALLPVVGQVGVEVALSGTMSVALEADMGAEWVAAPDRATTKALAPAGRFGFAVRF